ncbi:Receptor-like protein 43 [Citrus sinensis]|nr:Receptor-like protein 43 [Citrus sinensis]
MFLYKSILPNSQNYTNKTESSSLPIIETYSNVASWNQEEENSDCCLWDGIKCKEDTGHVIRLDLTCSCPYDSINSSSSLCQLVRLECRYCFYSSLCIGIFIILVFLSLTDCILQGEFPAEIFQLPKLVFLALTYDLYLTGYLPEFQNSSVLVDLRISHTRFSGKIPDSIENFESLYSLGIRGRMRIPVEIRKLTQLHILRLAENQLEGSVPSSIFELRNLQALDLSDNNLSGTGDLNFVLLNMESLTALLLSSNNSHICLHNQDQLLSLDLSSNKIAGQVPQWLLNVRINSLEYLNFSHNLLTGFEQDLFVLPWSKMNTLDLSFNKLMIDFDNNSLQGREPKSLANCVKLKFLNHGDSQITDVFPSWLGTLPEVEVLILKFNNFHGEIEEPQTAFEFPKHRIIVLSHNRFTETKAEIEYPKLSNLIAAIILSDNNFVGEIPTSIANLKGLRTLNLSNNNLQGYIPSTLNLSRNKLTGQIPQQVADLTSLSFFNVSHNHLIIPQATQFSTFTNDSFVGNPGLSGEPLPRKCENSDASPAEDDLYSESVIAFGLETVLAGCASRTIIGVALGYIFSTKV